MGRGTYPKVLQIRGWTVLFGCKQGDGDRSDHYSPMPTTLKLLQLVVCRPSDKDYMLMIEKGQLQNCPVASKDVKTAQEIFGPDVGSL
mmetsp:Transcript_9116/g.13178  ORF Transcript_9116/g.13178 Transcript_9116/m.13178 type:complete len:88 (-) Transcript_9116:115-378(-)